LKIYKPYVLHAKKIIMGQALIFENLIENNGVVTVAGHTTKILNSDLPICC
jgi:hypothetical protein